MNNQKLITAAFLYLGGVAVFVWGNPYYRNFPTNWNMRYYLTLATCFLLLALVFKRVVALARFSPAAYALFIAASALVFLKTGVLNIPASNANPVRLIALDKVSQFLHVVSTVLVLTLFARENLKSIFIQKGHWRYGLKFGLISFASFAVLGVILQWESRARFANLPATLPWLLIFVFSNAIMEELWLRAIFLKRYEVLVGRWPAIWVTALVFGTSHVLATYDFPGGGLVFGGVVFVLGVVGAQAMFKEDGLIGPVLFHAGYDLMIMVPILNSL